MSDTQYNGIFGTGFAFTFTPTTGTPFGTAQAQVEEANTPPVVIDTAKFTPISGGYSGKEQFALGRYPVQEYKMKVTYCAAEHAAALTCQAARFLGTLVCTYGDGSTDMFTNAAITSVAAGPNTATGLRTAEITVTVPVPSVFSSGSAITVVDTSVDAGSSLDLYAAPISGDGKAPIRMYLLNPISNANSITIETGALTGYTGFGADFSLTLKPGESCSLGATTDISSTVKLLDVTGTGTQTLIVQVQLQ